LLPACCDTSLNWTEGILLNWSEGTSLTVGWFDGTFDGSSLYIKLGCCDDLSKFVLAENGEILVGLRDCAPVGIDEGATLVVLPRDGILLARRLGRALVTLLGVSLARLLGIVLGTLLGASLSILLGSTLGGLLGM
jgi:hypothetical protein